MDPVTLAIILQAKNEGLDAISDVSRKLMDLREEASQTTAVLMFMSGQLKDLIDYTGLIRVVLGQLVGEMKDLKDAVADTNSKLDRLIVTTEAAAAASLTLAAATATAATATSAAGSAANSAAFSLFGMTGAMLVLVVAIATVLVVFAPMILLFAGAVVVVLAFAAGVVAVTTALALAFGPLALVTAGVIMLADRMFTSGQTLVDPLLKFETKLGDVADVWGKRATPMAAQMMDFFTGLLPVVQSAGNVVLTWFGQNLPTILQIAGLAVKDLEGAFKTLWTFFTVFFGSMKEHLPTFESFFGLLVQFGVGAIIGLISNLLKLSDWFLVRLPAMAPIVAAVFDGLGKFIQGFGKTAGDLVDWFIKNWPEIERTAQQTWDSLKAGWDFIAPMLRQLLPDAVRVLIELWKMLHEHSDQLRAVLFLLGGTFAILVGLALIVIAAISGLIIAVMMVIAWIQQFVNWVIQLNINLIQWIEKNDTLRASADLLGSVIHALMTVVGELPQALQNPIAAVDAIGNAFGQAAGAAQRLWDTISRQPGGTATGAWQGPTVPGGTGTSTSSFPSAQHGGTVPGLVGAPQMILAHGGEAVLSTDQLDTMISLLSQLVDNTTPRSPFVTAAYGRA